MKVDLGKARDGFLPTLVELEEGERVLLISMLVGIMDEYPQGSEQAKLADDLVRRLGRG
jgi:hypothetical protein